MINFPLKTHLITCFTIVAGFYGSWSIFSEVVRTIVPFGLILVLLLVAAIHLLRIPPPSPEAVEAVLGKDPYLVTPNDTCYVMKTVAHRGAGLDCPENSLVAFKTCAEKGCDTVEFDITLTKDNVPVVFHDDSLERMTELKVKILEQDWEDLQSVDISVKHIYGDRFANTYIPTLEEAVTQLLDCGQRMIIDIKDNDKKMVKVIHELFERHQELYSRAVVSSFFANIIYLIRKGNPKIVCSIAWRPHAFARESYNCPAGEGPCRYPSWYQHHLARFLDVVHEWTLPRITYYILGISVLLLHKDVINGRETVEWRKRGVRVMAWTVNSPAEKQYLARVLKVTYLTDTLTGEGTTHSTA